MIPKRKRLVSFQYNEASWRKECLKAAILQYGKLNTDQGSQSACPGFTEFISSQKDIRFSMDGKGRAVDNIFIERFWRSIKYEKIYIEPSDDGIELYGKIKEYMNFYNTKRGHQSLDRKKPEEVFRLAT